MAVAALMSVEEYLSRSWSPDLEYIDGRLLETNLGEIDHGDVQGRVYLALHSRGLLPLIAVRVQVRPTRFRVPDVLAIRGARPTGRFLREPPYIAVEILSPDDRADDVADKIDDYLDFGIPNIWYIDPRRRRVTVETRDGSHICRDVVETADGEFSIPLSEIFAEMASPVEEE